MRDDLASSLLRTFLQYQPSALERLLKDVGTLVAQSKLKDTLQRPLPRTFRRRSNEAQRKAQRCSRRVRMCFKTILVQCTCLYPNSKRLLSEMGCRRW